MPVTNVGSQTLSLIRCIRECLTVARLVGPVTAARWAMGAVLSAPMVAKTRSLTSADQFLGTTFDLRCGVRQLRVRHADFGVCREILGHDCYRLATCEGRLRTVIDLGANCGIFTLMAAVMNPDCHILAVDANPEFVAATSVNAALNGLSDRVAVVNALVGNATVPSIRDLIAVQPSISVFDPREAVQRLGGCDFLKCDVEGGEHALFTGDLSWLRSVRRLAIEYHWTDADGARLAQVIEAAGFIVERIPHRTLGYIFGVSRTC